MQGIAAFWRLACRADIKAWRFGDMHMLIRCLGYTAADNGEILFLIRPGGMGINKGRATGNQRPITHDASFHFLNCEHLCHLIILARLHQNLFPDRNLII